MNRSSQSEHAALISAVAERYRLDGYEVVIEPEPNAIPFDLGGYRPDLLARKGGVTTIVESRAKRRNSRSISYVLWSRRSDSTRVGDSY
jgi:hypothetical protein